MLATAEDIFEEINVEAALLNGEVVRRAMNGHCCDFVNHQAEFASLLPYYIALRMDIHRVRSRLVGSREDAPWQYWERGFIYAQEKLHDDKIMAKDARRRLKNIWPCAACIWLYNPTNRIRRFLTIC